MAALAVVVVKIQLRAVLETHLLEAHPKEVLAALVALHSSVYITHQAVAVAQDKLVQAQ